MWPAIQQSIPNARAVLVHDVAVRNADHDLRDVASINLYLEAGAAAEARASIEARLADMPNDSYGEAALIEWYCWDPIFHEDGIVAAKSWLIQHEDLGLTPYVQVRADFLKERMDHRLEVEQAVSVAGIFPALGLLLAVVLAWLGQRVLLRLAT